MITRVRYFVVAAFLLVGALIDGCVSMPETVPQIPGPIIWLNRPANFPLPKFKGKVTIIGFYTEDCSGCVKIQPTLQAVKNEFGQNIQIMGVYTPLPHQEPTLNEIKSFLEQHQVLYPVLIDGSTKILRKFHVTSWPTLIIADANSNITKRVHGTSRIINNTRAAVIKAQN